MARIGSVNVLVTNEQPRFQNEITQRRVESGSPVTDNIRELPKVIDISGVVQGSDAGARIAELRKISTTGQIVRYTGRNIFSNMVLEDFITSHTARTAQGFEFTATLREIKQAERSIFSVVTSDPQPQVDTTSTVASTPQAVSTQTKTIESKVVSTPKDKLIDTEVMAAFSKKYGAGGGGGGGWGPESDDLQDDDTRGWITANLGVNVDDVVPKERQASGFILSNVEVR